MTDSNPGLGWRKAINTHLGACWKHPDGSVILTNPKRGRAALYPHGTTQHSQHASLEDAVRHHYHHHGGADHA